MGAATVSYPGVVRIAADVPHLKGGGTDPFAAPRLWPQWTPGLEPFTVAKLRRAHRHGGLIPWSMLVERPNPIDLTLPIPMAAEVAAAEEAEPPEDPPLAYYLTEVAGHAGGTPPNWPTSLDWWDYDVHRGLDGVDFEEVEGEYVTDVTITPKPVLEAYLEAASDDAVAAMMIRPEPPTLSADDWYYLDPAGEYHQFSGPAAVVAVGSMERMQLVRAPTSGMNTRTTGAQAQYVSRYTGGSSQPIEHGGYAGNYNWYGATWDGTDWIVDRNYAQMYGMYYYAFAGLVHGWTRAAEIDPETGAVSTTYKVPDGGVLNVALRGAFDVSGHAPYAACLTWPNAIRLIAGSYSASTTSEAPRLMWRPAERWRARFRVDPYYTPVWVNIDDSAIGGGGIAGTITFNDLFRGYFAEESAAAEDATGDWKLLCSFDDWDGDTDSTLGDPTWGATLPAPGDEILITAWHDTMHSVPTYPADGTMRIFLYPEPTVLPICVPLMLGTVIQGGDY